jgi:hypothetical protein
MSYLDQFVSALRFYFELNPAEPAPCDFDDLRQHFLHQQSSAQAPSMANTRKFLTLLAERFVEGYPGDIAHACHAASAGFLHSWNASRLPGLPGTLSLTVGSVYFKGEPVFETTRAAIAGLIAAGRAPAIDLPVHVWLTLDDLTVIDLSIVPTLVKYGRLPADTPPVLFWRENAAGAFVFDPLLVDNLFFERIDSGSFTAPAPC